MKKPQTIKNRLFLSLLVFSISFYASAQPGNDACSAAVSLTPGTAICNTVSGTLKAASGGSPNATGTASINTFCTATNTSPDVWYKFVATSTFPTITLSNMGTSMDNNPVLQLFKTNSCTASMLNSNSNGCTNGSATTNLALVPTTALTIGQEYLIRVATTASMATGTSANWSFDICVSNPPANNDCANATLLTSASTCINGVSSLSNQTLTAATVEGSGIATSCGGSTTSQDVWYKFIAPSDFPNIKVTNLGSSWGTSLRIQLLDGTCGTFTEVGCANNAPLTPSTALTIGKTYYVRILKSNTNIPYGNNWGFDICLTGTSSRMNEVFKQTILSGANVLSDPWEITYGPDNFLWVTESKGYKVNKIDPNTGAKTMVLDISQNSTFLPVGDRTFNCQFANGSGAQGGLAGLALHPKFLDPVTPQNYVYISYIYSQTSTTVFTNRIVRFTYNTGTNRLESPVSICDTLPGSSDHNSQRMIIAPVGSTDYLFYAAGDMGAGQFGNVNRTQKAQFTNAYEGKILRFNLVPDADAGTLDRWIPNDNPYNASLGVQSAVWAIGIRNNQGFAYDRVNNVLYGSSHGPFSDDEINILESGKNYGHPLVIGYSWDDNVNGTTAGAAPNMNPAHPSSCPVIVDESNNAAALGANYRDPLFSAYPSSSVFPSITSLWNTTSGANAQWPSEGWSGLDLYTSPYIPGWKQSLVATSLKWGRLVRLKLNSTGNAVVATGGADTVTYFGSINRYRDVAFSPNGKDVFVIMDKSTSSSGPSSANPVVPACAGCLQKYTFLGYVDHGGKSSIPDAVPITNTTANTVTSGTSVTIDASNNNLWVPITGPDGNVMAELYANGQNLGVITSSFYQHSGAARVKGAIKYLNRSITINPANPPSGSVKVRFYISTAEYNALAATSGSFLTAPADLKIFKNSDANGTAMTASTTSFFPHSIALRGTSSDAYVLQSDTISSFSTFYFAASSTTLPLDLITFTGNLQNDNSVLLKWKTENEVNTSHFVIERSTNGTSFTPIGTVSANGNGSVFNYAYTDKDAATQSSSKLYYRLKMFDLDNKFTYSDIVTITLPYISGRIAVYPNPFANDLTVAIGAPKDGRVQWKLIDNAGRVVMQQSEWLRRGNNTLLINVNKLSSGFYYLSIEGAGIDRKVKLQKQ